MSRSRWRSAIQLVVLLASACDPASFDRGRDEAPPKTSGGARAMGTTIASPAATSRPGEASSAPCTCAATDPLCDCLPDPESSVWRRRTGAPMPSSQPVVPRGAACDCRADDPLCDCL